MNRLRLSLVALLLATPGLLSGAGVDSPEYQQKLEAAKKVVADWNALPPDQIHADSSAVDWPGAVPAEAARLKDQRFDLNTDFPRWRGKTDRVTTGYYAPAGEVVTVEVPESFAKLGVQVRIGCHSDNANKKSVAKRFPYSISKAWPLNAAVTKVASPFGGTVYLEVPKEVTGKTIPVRFSGVVQQPWFVLGKTSPTEWREKVRNYPGPFAEMSCGPLTLSVPSADVRKLDDPTALMTFYKKGMACVQDLSGPPVPVVERIVYDVSISAGSMHSGYPVMAGSKRKEASDLTALENGLWGFFHEIGHNQQWGGWSPPGQGETTCNLFPLYVMSQVQGKKPKHPWKFDRTVLAKPLERGAIGSNLNGNHAISIAFWIQLINGIGWEPVKKTIHEYHAKDAPEAPKGAEPIWDRLMLTLSKHSRKDLTQFFKAWGAEFSPAGEEAVKKLHLPVWLPDDAPGQPKATEDTGSI